MGGLNDFADKVAVITGGGSGIGLGLAQALVARGARVALIGTDADRLEKAVTVLTELGGVAFGQTLDVTDRAGWPGALDAIESRLGPIDFVALNAGAQGGRRRVEDIPAAEWDWVWGVNVDGVYNGLAAALPRLRDRGTPAHLLVTASIASVIPRAQVTAYGASKAAALALAQAVRIELVDSPIGISVLCPGLVRTPIAETMRRHAPVSDATTFAYMSAAPGVARDPVEIGNLTLDAVARGDFYIFTHPEHAPTARAMLQEIEAALSPG